jgi:hypothetical protein
VWYRWEFPTASYRYKLTIAVESDGQIHSGSSVIEAWYRFNPPWAAAIGKQIESAIQGQAVLINLGGRGALIAALHSGTASGHVGVSASELAGRAFLPALAPRNASGFPGTPENIRALSQMHGAVDLVSSNLPLFIWFSNLADPNTARMVKSPEFASVIGDETRLVSARVEMTHDPIVIDLDKQLPWYNRLKASSGLVNLNATHGMQNGALGVDGFLVGYTAFIGNGVPQ